MRAGTGAAVGGLLAGLTLLVGCSNLRVELGDPVDLELCRSLPEGLSRAEVLEALGPPTSVVASQGNLALIYEYHLLDEKQFGLGLTRVGAAIDLLLLGWLKVSFGRSRAVRQAVVLLFDREARLCATSVHSWGEDFGKGAGLQFVFQVDEVIDRGSLEEEPTALRWGRSLLLSPQEMLNRPHRAALEQRDHATYAGQRTLELPLPQGR